MKVRRTFTRSAAQRVVPLLQRQEGAFLKIRPTILIGTGIATGGFLVIYITGSLLTFWDLTSFLFFLAANTCWQFFYVAYLRAMLLQAIRDDQLKETIQDNAEASPT